MEYVRSRPLRDLIRRRPLPETEAARIGLGILDALRAAHAKGIMHRDVKPANILIGDDRRVVLTDFGLAVLGGHPALTRSGAVVGTAPYVAPERINGNPATPAADLWSLGITLFRTVEGWSPFQREGVAACAPPRSIRPLWTFHPCVEAAMADEVLAAPPDRARRRPTGGRIPPPRQPVVPPRPAASPAVYLMLRLLFVAIPAIIMIAILAR
jgi:serine/threonine protein kinase